MAFLVILLLGFTMSAQAASLDPPENIGLVNGDLYWDEVPGASEYHVYYFTGPVPSDTVTGNYLSNTTGTLWPLERRNSPYGYYTVVAVQTFGGPNPVEYSAVTDGAIVPFLANNQAGDATTALRKSGQTQSYYPGDDGATQIGIEATIDRYSSNGDGTFTDTLTNLVWIADGDCIVSMSWLGALDFANSLSADGTSSCASLQDGSSVGDWRSPNIIELMSLYNYSTASGIADVPLMNITGDLMTDTFWSSTSFSSTPTPNDTGLAWQVKYISDPDTGSRINQKSTLGRAWAVRDAE